MKATEHTHPLGRRNTARVREWFAAHMGATNIECAAALGLSNGAVGRHVQIIRQEWSENPVTTDPSPSECPGDNRSALIKALDTFETREGVELRECPHCGGQAMVKEFSTSSAITLPPVFCQDCGAAAPSVFIWNARIR